MGKSERKHKISQKKEQEEQQQEEKRLRLLEQKHTSGHLEDEQTNRKLERTRLRNIVKEFNNERES